ncbi:hypothetical protein TNCV_643381 [Trichonephila clavipes]|nr:hypothetical protein TNCV_643381 [Trichonephila clavipes]
MSSGRLAVPCTASDICPVAGWQNPVLRQGYIQWPGGRTFSFFRGMSSGWLAEPYPGSGICSVVGWQNLVYRQVYVLWPGGRTFSSNPFLSQGYIQWPGCRTLSFVGGMSSNPVSELRPASWVCPVAGWQNSVLRRGYNQ